MYQSLPNKYRPILFKDLVGQEHNQRFFKALIRNGQTSRNIALAGHFGSSKCVTMDTLVYTNKGIIPISEISDNRNPDTFSAVSDCSVCNIDGEMESISQFYYNGVKPCKKITSKWGFAISGTLVHPLLCMNKNTGDLEYVQIGDISKELHYLVIQSLKKFPESDYKFSFEEQWATVHSHKYSSLQREGKLSIPKQMSSELAQLLGMVIADGYANPLKGGLNLVCDIGIDPDLESVIVNLFKSVFNYVPIYVFDKRRMSLSNRVTGTPSKLVRFTLSSIQAKKFFESLGCKSVTAEFKEVPFAILRSTKEIQAAFLSGLFECDGTISGRTNKSTGEIIYSSKSPKLIKQIHLMLFNFGIISTIKARDCAWTYKGVKKHGIYWTLHIHDKYSRSIFRNEIGLISVRKKRVLEEITDNTYKMQYGKTFNIPCQAEKVKDVLKSFYAGWGKIPKQESFGNVFYNSVPVTYNQLYKFRDFCEQGGKPFHPLFEEYLQWREKGYYFDEIESISEVFEAEVCDISVDGTHSFNAAGFVSHNTTTARIYARALLCEHPTEDGEPCNQCESCLKSLEGVHPDIMEIDASSKGGKEDIINLVEIAKTPPLFSKHRVIIDDEVQAHSRQAWDALLKLIEEPPPFLTFIFCTTEKDKVRPAILSRCAVRDVNLLDRQKSIEHLKHICDLEGFRYEESALKAIAQVSQGHPRDLLKNLEQVSFLGDISIENTRTVLNDSLIDEVYRFLISLHKNEDMVGKILMSTIPPSQMYNMVKEVILHFKYNVFQQRGVSFNPLIDMVDPEISHMLFDRIKDTASLKKLSCEDYLDELYKSLTSNGRPEIRSDMVVIAEMAGRYINSTCATESAAKGSNTGSVRRRREFVNSYRKTEVPVPQVVQEPEPPPPPPVTNSGDKVYTHTLMQNGFELEDMDTLDIVEL